MLKDIKNGLTDLENKSALIELKDKFKDSIIYSSKIDSANLQSLAVLDKIVTKKHSKILQSIFNSYSKVKSLTKFGISTTFNTNYNESTHYTQLANRVKGDVLRIVQKMKFQVKEGNCEDSDLKYGMNVHLHLKCNLKSIAYICQLWTEVEMMDCSTNDILFRINLDKNTYKGASTAKKAAINKSIKKYTRTELENELFKKMSKLFNPKWDELANNEGESNTK